MGCTGLVITSTRKATVINRLFQHGKQLNFSRQLSHYNVFTGRPMLTHRFTPFLNVVAVTPNNLNAQAIRQFAIISPHVDLPTPPPREFNADGSPKTYRLNQKVYEHKYDHERWYFLPVGVFHSVYHCDLGQNYSSYRAWQASYPLWTQVVVRFLVILVITQIILIGPHIGVKPKVYTIEWQEAMRERDRAENTNPMTRYLDRRRKERGAHWVLKDYLPTHPFFFWMKDQHDTELLRERA